MLEHVLALTNRPRGAKALARVTTATRQELAATLAGAGVKAPFMPPITDLESGRHGASWAIARIMFRHGARGQATGLTAAQIETEFRPIAGRFQHSPASLAVFLCQYMPKKGFSARGKTKGQRSRYWLTPEGWAIVKAKTQK